LESLFKHDAAVKSNLRIGVTRIIIFESLEFVRNSANINWRFSGNSWHYQGCQLKQQNMWEQ
jgi:hypothetical protein